MDRVMVYDGALPQTTDILNASKFAMVGDAFQNRAILGTTTVVAGLACSPTTPTPDLHVTIGVGSIYQMDPTDASAYADLGVDNNSIVKQGILAAAVQLTLTPPGTVGFSQVYLVQAIMNNVDGGQMVLSYYNSANPAAPYSGPANSGSSNFTTRQCACVIALKAGVPATTGTQVTPSPDAGYVGLYAITVANGATQITSGNIAQLVTAPFFPTLPSVPSAVQNGTWVYANDIGALNALVITPINPVVTALVAGMGFRVKVLVTNTGGSTILINGAGGATFGPITIRRGSNVAVAAADLTSGAIVDLVYDGTNFQMANYLGAAATSNTNTVVNIPYVADSGTLNALVGTYSPAILVGALVAGLTIEIKLANTITGACNINVSGLGNKPVKTGDLQNPPPNVYVAGEVLLLAYDGTQFQIVNTSSLTYRKPLANTTIFVNGSTGSDTLYDGTAASVGAGTSGPLATIAKAVSVAFGYAPSQFTITISIAAGTYNESITTPSFAGPNLVIDGNVMATTIVNSAGALCFAVRGPNTVNVTRLTAQNTGSPSVAHGFVADSGALLSVVSCATNAIAGAVFLANNGGFCAPSLHTFNGSSANLFSAQVNGVLKMGGNYTIGTPINVSNATCLASQGGQIDMGFTPGSVSFTNSGFVSGLKYSAQLNGVIVATSIGGAASIPGTGASQTTGGQVI